MSGFPVALPDARIAILGLGYAGLPLAVEFGKQRPVTGYDLSARRIAELRAGLDATCELSAHELSHAEHLTFSNDAADLEACGLFIVAVPTPIDAARRPDLTLLKMACRTVGAAMRNGALVIFESTVYPGCTRAECVPVLEQASGLVFDTHFSVGYSPERVNPGDRDRRLPDIVKVVSASTPTALDTVDALYRTIIRAGTHRAPTIEVAEAAKVIENTQRDLNIALMNELAVLFGRLEIDTQDVLAAAATKWNFMPFKPGLVGGHCIGVDPYYLTHRAQEIGHHPDVILAGRRINDAMGGHVANEVALLMMRRQMPVVGSRVLVMGLTFKENCVDLRNTKVTDIVARLRDMSALVDVHDPCASVDDAMREHGIALVETPTAEGYDAIIVAVAHEAFVAAGIARIRSYGRPGAVLYDVKGAFPKADTDGRL